MASMPHHTQSGDAFGAVTPVMHHGEGGSPTVSTPDGIPPLEDAFTHLRERPALSSPSPDPAAWVFAPSYQTRLKRELRRQRWENFLVLLGTRANPALVEEGLHPERVRLLTWRYEHKDDIRARAERREYKRKLAERFAVFTRRVESLRCALAPVFGRLEPDDVEIFVPLEYDELTATTGDVLVRRGETRIPYDEEPAEAVYLAPVRLVLPNGFNPELKAPTARLVKEYLGGEWVPRWYMTAHPHYVEFSRTRARPAPPTRVEWEPTDDIRKVFIGHDGVGPVIVSTSTESPHWAVAGGTGSGKTSTLLLPLANSRYHGALVDIIDLKEDSFERSAMIKRKNRVDVDVLHEVSGVRIHREVKTAVQALAEFYVSIKSMRLAREAGYPMDTIPHRFLIFDEFGSFIQSADLWWKHGLQQKGVPPFGAWFHQILMQGRTKNHLVVIGTHDFGLGTFKSTQVRDLIGLKALVRNSSYTAWLTTFGHGVKRCRVDARIPGRAAVGLVGEIPREVQIAHLPEDRALEFLQSCPPAPEWFDAGEIAPWITPKSIIKAHEEAFVTPFLPGGEFAISALDGTGDNGGTVIPMQGKRFTPTPIEERELTQREALERGLLPLLLKSVQARHSSRSPEDHIVLALKIMRKARERGAFPEPRAESSLGHQYLVADMQAWERDRYNDSSSAGTGA